MAAIQALKETEITNVADSPNLTRQNTLPEQQITQTLELLELIDLANIEKGKLEQLRPILVEVLNLNNPTYQTLAQLYIKAVENDTESTDSNGRTSNRRFNILLLILMELQNSEIEVPQEQLEKIMSLLSNQPNQLRNYLATMGVGAVLVIAVILLMLANTDIAGYKPSVHPYSMFGDTTTDH